MWIVLGLLLLIHGFLCLLVLVGVVEQTALMQQPALELAIDAALLIALLLGWGRRRFERGTAAEMRTLLDSAPTRPETLVMPSALRSLPRPVARWLTRAGVVGRPYVRTALLRQHGKLRGGLDQPLQEATAEQLVTIDQPGFVWSVRTRMMGVLPVLGRDTFLRGHGHMKISAGGLVSVADASGQATDQGTLLRFLAETVWFPSAALAPYIQWQAIDDHTAEATMTYQRLVVSARFSFDAEGRFAGLRARRYLGEGEAMKLELWEVVATQWERWSGVEVPSEGVVRWKLERGDVDAYRWEITELEHDPDPTSLPVAARPAGAPARREGRARSSTLDTQLSVEC